MILCIAIYLIDVSKVWLLCIVDTNLSINGKKNTWLEHCTVVFLCSNFVQTKTFTEKTGIYSRSQCINQIVLRLSLIVYH